MKEKKTGFHYGYVVLLATILMNVDRKSTRLNSSH